MQHAMHAPGPSQKSHRCVVNSAEVSSPGGTSLMARGYSIISTPACNTGASSTGGGFAVCMHAQHDRICASIGRCGCKALVSHCAKNLILGSSQPRCAKLPYSSRSRKWNLGRMPQQLPLQLPVGGDTLALCRNRLTCRDRDLSLVTSAVSPKHGHDS